MRRRLVVSIAGVASVAVVLLAVPLGLVLGRSYRDEELLRLQRDTIAATREIDLGSTPGDAIELPGSPDTIAVYALSARRVAGRGPAIAPPVVKTALRSGRPATAAGAGELTVAVPLLQRERVAGAVLARRSDRAAGRATRDAWLVLAAVAAAIIAAAVVAALLLGRRLARPLERLATAAGRLGDGDFSTRAPRAGVGEVDAVCAALDATAERLDDLVQRERAFTADASHQLRTPLAALRLELEAMQLRDSGGPELAAALTQVERLQATLETLLTVARDRPKRDAVTDLGRSIAALEERWRGPLAEAGRPLRVAGEVSVAPVRADPGVVQEILEVLLSNACEHGGGAVVVTVRQHDQWGLIDVSDEGHGFADLESAFERRSPGARGHGVGLSLARSLAHAEGGRLSISHGGGRPTVRLALRSAGGVGGGRAVPGVSGD